MKRLSFILSVFCLAGCMANKGLETDAISDNNRYHLSKLRKGMYEAQVLAIMRQPYKYESFELGDDIYDVWFYITNPTVLGQSRMVAQNLTPLSFKNGILVGTGYDYYYYITRESAREQAERTPPVEKPPLVQPRPPIEKEPAAPTQTAEPSSKKASPENKELEQSLEKATQPSAPPSPAPQKATLPQKVPRRKPETLQPSPKPTAPILSYDYYYHYPASEPIKLQTEEASAESAPQTEETVAEQREPAAPDQTAELQNEAVAAESQEPTTPEPAAEWQNETVADQSQEPAAPEPTAELQNEVAAPAESEVASQAAREEAPSESIAFTRPVKKAKVRKGMSESEVEGLLGAPRDMQTFYLANDTYHVWFYSRNTRTPLTFKNGILVGTTTDYYQGIKQAANHDQIEGYDKRGERMQQDEMEQDFDYW